MRRTSADAGLARTFVLLSFVALTLFSKSMAASRPHVLVISIDGMRPDYVTKADEHHLKIPTLRGLMKNGTYADGVVGVIPTYTYPSHTTLVTGVSPAVHGVYNNQKFDPLGTLHGAVFTDYDMIKVETLWHVAKMAGYTTASVGWPVTTGSNDIDYLMPANAVFEGKSADGEKVEASNSNIHFDHPAGLREVLEPDVPKGDLSIDERRFAWMTAILRRYKPGFMTTHLGELDHAEHATGPFSEESNRALEMLDGEVAQLIALERSIDPNAYIVVVSDHGFEPIEKTVNLGVLFARAGLVHHESATVPGSWDATLWPSGGTAAVMLHDPTNQTVRSKAESLIRDAAKDPEYGIAHILTHDEVIKRGGYPDAAFLIELSPGFKFGGAMKGDVVTPSPHTGTHGFLPERPELYASFLLTGPGVARGRDLGVIDMRQIAPTLARILHVQLPTAKQPPVHYER